MPFDEWPRFLLCLFLGDRYSIIMLASHWLIDQSVWIQCAQLAVDWSTGFGIIMLSSHWLLMEANTANTIAGFTRPLSWNSPRWWCVAAFKLTKSAVVGHGKSSACALWLHGLSLFDLVSAVAATFDWLRSRPLCFFPRSSDFVGVYGPLWSKVRLCCNEKSLDYGVEFGRCNFYLVTLSLICGHWFLIWSA